jgi:hypothetical protein
MRKLGLATTAFGAFITIGSLGNWFGRPTSVNVAAILAGSMFGILGIALTAYAVHAEQSLTPMPPSDLHGPACAASQAGRHQQSEYPDETTVTDRVLNAASRVALRDRWLLEKDVNERSLTHRFAIYLEDEFPWWDVDCEYNRDHDDSKRLNLYPEDIKSDDTQGTTVFPDIIVHKRGSDVNLLVIEVKKTSSRRSSDHDERKLRAFKEQLQYRYARLVTFLAGEQDGATVESKIL